MIGSLSRRAVCRAAFGHASLRLVFLPRTCNFASLTCNRIADSPITDSSRDQKHEVQRPHPRYRNIRDTKVDLANLTFDDPKLAFGSIPSGHLFKYALLLSILRLPGETLLLNSKRSCVAGIR